MRIFTDGSCNYKNKIGGLGVYFDTNPTKYISKGFYNTTVGRMEVTALYYALKNCPMSRVDVTVYSDSQYVVRSIMERWVYGWEMKNFKICKNGDLWVKVVREIRKRPLMNLELKHIKGHQKDLENELVFGNTIADLLADYKRHKIYHKDLENE